MEKWKGPMSGERGTSVLTVGEDASEFDRMVWAAVNRLRITIIL